VTLSVRLFASYADAFGGRAIPVSVALPSTVHAVVEAMRGLPGGDRLPAEPLVAVNHSYASMTDTVQVGDEVALIPPVAGG
jgi:molybdopterin converting factor small subunit